MASSPLTLETERLLLTLPDADSAPRLVSYFETNRAHLSPWEPPLPPGLFTNTFWERRLDQNRSEYLGGKSMRLVLVEKHAPMGPVVGLANFTQIVRGAFLCCTLGYSLDEDMQGNGYMQEALVTAIRHCFDELGLHRVQANYLPINERSGSLLRRLGFVVEGYARDYLYINGRWRDHILTAKTKNDNAPPDYVHAIPGARPR
ncbi:MAG: GNAT family N-acetyltransferase [Myxococcales bacterium]|nr:GNAT family N-acetyltransferase [Myxococcales bacterium]